MVSSKLVIACIALLLCQESLGLSFGSFIDRVKDKIEDRTDDVKDATKKIIDALKGEAEDVEDTVFLSDIDIDEDDDVEVVAVDSNKEEDAAEETEEIDLVAHLEGIEKQCRLAKKYTKKQYETLEVFLATLDNKGQIQENLPANCLEILRSGKNESGVYTIGLPSGPFSRTTPTHVYCDMETDGGGWLVIQRREDGSQYFKLGWSQYAAGFGDVANEFWIGNRALNLLTTSADNQMRIDMLDGEGVSRYASYSAFQVGSELDKFRLTVSGYTGNAGDSLSYHNGKFFSTIDQDNDGYSESCAQRFKGGWWYYKCHLSNLNGAYLNGAHSSYADGVGWQTWHGYYYSIQTTEMKIRPVV